MIIAITVDTDKAVQGSNEVPHERPDAYRDTAFDVATFAIIATLEQLGPEDINGADIEASWYDGGAVVGSITTTMASSPSAEDLLSDTVTHRVAYEWVREGDELVLHRDVWTKWTPANPKPQECIYSGVAARIRPGQVGRMVRELVDEALPSAPGA